MEKNRQKVRDYILPDLPGYNVLLGGTDSIDIMRSEINTTYGVKKLADSTGISFDEMIFVGDAIFPGGNNYSLLDTGIISKKVFSIHDTKESIETLISK